MIEFYNEDLKKNFIESIKYIMSSLDNNQVNIYSDEIGIDSGSIQEDIKYLESLKCVGDKYSDEEIIKYGLRDGDQNRIVIDKNSEIDIYFYDDDSAIQYTIDTLINYIEKSKSSSFDNNGACFSDRVVIFRVCPNNLYYDSSQFFPEFYKSLKYNDKNFEIKISSQNSFYSLMISFTDAVNEYNPVIMADDLFIEISSDKNIDYKDENIYEIFNSYIFEIFASYDIKLDLNPRTIIYYYDEKLDDIFDYDNIKLRPLLFGKGLKDVIILFNNAESNGIADRAIIEYIKVIEYVSQTVIRMEITEEARKKLNSNVALNPDANYIKELENMFIEYNNKYSTDRNAIKATILKCCDIKQLVRYSPKFLKKLSNFEKNFSNPKSNRTEILNYAYEELCNSISDTRNDLSHAKANYSPNGYECPNDEKEDFVVLLRHICIQVIRWFSNISENNRIINEEK